MKAMDETDDKIMTVMLKNDQNLTKVTGQRKHRKLTFIFYDQNNETILSFNAMDI